MFVCLVWHKCKVAQKNKFDVTIVSRAFPELPFQLTNVKCNAVLRYLLRKPFWITNHRTKLHVSRMSFRAKLILS